MSSAFLYGGGELGLSDGTADINVASVSVQGLSKNLPVRTDANKKLTSSLLSISDTLGLNTALAEKTVLDFVHTTTPPVPPAGQISVYSKSDNNLYQLSSNGVERPLGSGGGGANRSIWTFSNTIGGTPANGYLNFNNATPASVTDIAINVINKDGIDLSPVLQTLAMGDTLLLSNDNSTNTKLYLVSDLTAGIGFYTVSVTLEAQSSTTNYNDSDQIGVQFYIAQNPFDQTLNTTDDVKFNKTEIISASSPTLKLTEGAAGSPNNVQIYHSGGITAIDNNGSDIYLTNSGASGLIVGSGSVNPYSQPYDIGAPAVEFRDLYLAGAANIGGDVNISSPFPSLILKNSSSTGAQISMRNSTNQVDANINFLFDNLTLQNVVGSAVHLLTSTSDGLAVTNTEIKPHQDAIAIGTVAAPFTDLHLSGQANAATLDVSGGGTIGGTLDMGTNKITSTYVPVNDEDLVNKLYVTNSGSAQTLQSVYDNSTPVGSQAAVISNTAPIIQLNKTSAGGNHGIVMKNPSNQSCMTLSTSNDNANISTDIPGKSVVLTSNNVGIQLAGGAGAGSVTPLPGSYINFGSAVDNFRNGFFSETLNAGSVLVNGINVESNLTALNTKTQNIGTVIPNNTDITGNVNISGFLSVPTSIVAGNISIGAGGLIDVESTLNGLQGQITSNDNDITALNAKTQNITAVAGTTTLAGVVQSSTLETATIQDATNNVNIILSPSSILMTADSGPAVSVNNTGLVVGSKNVGETIQNMSAINGTTSLTGGLTVPASINTGIVYINTGLYTNTINPRSGAAVAVSSDLGVSGIVKVDTIEPLTSASVSVPSLTVNGHILQNTAGNVGKILDLNQIESVAPIPGVPGVTLPPTMPSNTFVDGAGTWVASASSFWSGAGGFGGPAYNAFNNSTSTLWYSNNTIPNKYNQTTGIYTANQFNTNGYFGEWIQIAFPVAQTIATYRITQYGTTQVQGVIPTQFKIFSSDDGSTWTERDDRNITWDIPDNERFRDFTLPTAASGQYWRLACNVVGQPGAAAFRGLCQIAGLSFSTAGIDPICPAGCFRVNNETHIVGDFGVATNATIGGILDVAFDLNVGSDLTVSGELTRHLSYCQANWMDNTAQTVITVVNTYYPVVGTYANIELDEFTVAGSLITYTGTVTKRVIVNINACWLMAGGNGNKMRIGVFRNGVLAPSSVVGGLVDDNSTYPRNIGTGCILSLDGGDTVEVRANNTDGTNNLIMECLSTQIMEV